MRNFDRRWLPSVAVVALLGSLAAGCGDSKTGKGLPLPPPAASPSPSATPTTTGSQYWYLNDTLGQPLKVHTATETTFANEVLNIVNQERATAGVAALALDVEAGRAAKAHAEDMVGRSYFSHNTPESWGPGVRLQMLAVSGYSSWGENIAAGQSTAAAVMNAWMNSSGHRANILNPNFTHLGIGVDEDGGPHWVQVFLTLMTHKLPTLLLASLAGVLMGCSGVAGLRVGVALGDQVALESRGESDRHLDVVCVPAEGVSDVTTEPGDVGFTVEWKAGEESFAAVLTLGEGEELNASWKRLAAEDSPDGGWALESETFPLSSETPLRLILETNGALTPE